MQKVVLKIINRNNYKINNNVRYNFVLSLLVSSTSSCTGAERKEITILIKINY